MKVKLTRLLITIKSSFWFIPLLISSCGILAAIFILDIDDALKTWSFYSSLSFLSMPTETARLVLATIAGAMITVVSLVFSMTLVALILVSQQLGPRILIQFMDDRPTQTTLGLFNATFLFSLIVLMRVDTSAAVGEVEGIVIFVSVMLTIASIFTLIHFIHHIANRIQADVIVRELGADLKQASERYIKKLKEQRHQIPLNEYQELKNDFENRTNSILIMENSGYIQQLDNEKALAFAREKDLVFELKTTPGEFILSGLPLMAVYSRNSHTEISDDEKEILVNLFSVSQKRTPEASIDFEINAITEVALRALSSGINDPQTAIFCINWLADGLKVLMEIPDRPQVLKDEQNVIRILYSQQNFSQYLYQAFDGIIEACARNKNVQSHLIKVLRHLSSLSSVASHKENFTQYISKIEGQT